AAPVLPCRCHPPPCHLLVGEAAPCGDRPRSCSSALTATTSNEVVSVQASWLERPVYERAVWACGPTLSSGSWQQRSRLYPAVPGAVNREIASRVFPGKGARQYRGER